MGRCAVQLHWPAYTVRETQFCRHQSAAIPIWVAGVWPGTKPFRRAARYTGVAPIPRGGHTAIARRYPRADGVCQPHRTATEPYDVVMAGPPLAAEQYAALGRCWGDMVSGWLYVGGFSRGCARAFAVGQRIKTAAAFNRTPLL